ncbi:MAG: glycosyl hydrolase [Acutalibacteraceae bacterium]
MKSILRKTLSVLLCALMMSSLFGGCSFQSGADALWDDAYADETNGFADKDAVKNTVFYLNGVQSTNYNADAAQNDTKFLFESGSATRVVHRANGYCLTLPYTGVETDNTLGALKTVYRGEGYQLTVSFEDKSPYGNVKSGWNIYLTEWLNRFIDNDDFIRQNDLSRTREVINSKDILNGYTVMVYDIEIKDAAEIALPYYHIAIVRKNTAYDRFYLLNMKTASESTELFDTILQSFTPIESVGTPVNTVGQYELQIPDYWSEETRAYYDSLLAKMDNGQVDWGFFTNSMPASNDGNYRSTRMNLKSNINWISGENGINTSMQILPTYLHLGGPNKLSSFPLDLAKEFAGGNGQNGKPVLQLSYQFTRTNNTELDGKTPMYDILRGEYDDHFRAIAKDIKEYGKPVLVRLNNEMNSDWTSYCGMVTLLDPDLFVATWQRMYDIFREEGVDNTIWIFNPIAKSCPYSNWGDTLCYMPGTEYMQVLGLTSYEMGNDTVLPSFESMYKTLYDVNKENFASWPMIIGEFACGAGGENKGLALGRNADKRTVWVQDMFACLQKKTEEGYEFCKNIVGMVWFDTNDYDGYSISNYLEVPRDETATWAAFREGLAAVNGTEN